MNKYIIMALLGAACLLAMMNTLHPINALIIPPHDKEIQHVKGNLHSNISAILGDNTPIITANKEDKPEILYNSNYNNEDNGLTDSQDKQVKQQLADLDSSEIITTTSNNPYNNILFSNNNNEIIIYYSNNNDDNNNSNAGNSEEN